jgi:hypothetical protein
VRDESASCERCLYVNLDFLRRPADSGEDAWNGCEEDILAKVPGV